MFLDGSALNLEAITKVAFLGEKVQLGESAREKVIRSREIVERIIETGQVSYGINTGFGGLSDVTIANDQLSQLQFNLVRSHCCGFGEPLSVPQVRAMMLLRANVLAIGCSGCRPEVIDQICEFLNHGISPVVPSRGSVGASGDLAPLAHLALAFIGEGKVNFRGEIVATSFALERCGLKPLHLKAKEGLALLNGTQAIGSVGALALARGHRLLWQATLGGAMTLEALRGTPTAFDDRIHQVRNHPEQIEVASYLREILADSEIRESHRHGDSRVQDAYCLRCIPQVHGACLQALNHATLVLERETAAATDNPLVFAEDNEILSGGNFHGAPLALALDYARIALVQLMSIIERRIDRLVNPEANEGLPAFLATNPGLESGFMMLHVSAAAALNEARILAHPAASDNTPTSGGKEDHVSMGMTSALMTQRVCELLEVMVSIEWLVAARGLDFRSPLKAGQKIHVSYLEFRKKIKPMKTDRVISTDLETAIKTLRAMKLP